MDADREALVRRRDEKFAEAEAAAEAVRAFDRADDPPLFWYSSAQQEREAIADDRIERERAGA